MIVQRFLAWAPTAMPDLRAEAAGALARVYLYSDLIPGERERAAAALTLLLEDRCLDVRQNISEAFASHPAAPRHIVLALAHDAPDIAMPVLQRSPVLNDQDLIEILATRGEEVQAAIASRPDLSAALAAAIGEIAGPRACVVLLQNAEATFTPGVFARLTQRYGNDQEIRSILLNRSDVPISERQILLLRLAHSLGRVAEREFQIGKERVRQLTEDAAQRATLMLAGEEAHNVPGLVSHLRISEQLTTGLVLKALLRGDLGFVRSAFSELTGMELHRVERFLEEPERAGFRALYRSAGFPDPYLSVFQAGLSSWYDSDRRGLSIAAGRKQAAERALQAAESHPRELGQAINLLSRIATEAARYEARERLQAYAEPLRLAAA